MQGKMCWLSISGSDGEKVLHLQMNPHEPWRPYTAFPMFAAPDHAMPGGSKGLATYQKLHKAGWTLIPTTQGRSY